MTHALKKRLSVSFIVAIGFTNFSINTNKYFEKFNCANKFSQSHNFAFSSISRIPEGKSLYWKFVSLNLLMTENKSPTFRIIATSLKASIGFY